MSPLSRALRYHLHALHVIVLTIIPLWTNAFYCQSDQLRHTVIVLAMLPIVFHCSKFLSTWTSLNLQVALHKLNYLTYVAYLLIGCVDIGLEFLLFSGIGEIRCCFQPAFSGFLLDCRPAISGFMITSRLPSTLSFVVSNSSLRFLKRISYELFPLIKYCKPRRDSVSTKVLTSTRNFWCSAISRVSFSIFSITTQSYYLRATSLTLRKTPASGCRSIRPLTNLFL